MAPDDPEGFAFRPPPQPTPRITEDTILDVLEGMQQRMANAFAATNATITSGFQRIERRIMSEQSEIDTETAAVLAANASETASDTAIATAVSAIAAEIATLQAANPALDLTALNEAVSAATDAATTTSTESTAVTGLEAPAPTTGS